MAEPSTKRQKVDVDALQKRIKDLEHRAEWWESMLDLWKESIHHHFTDNLSHECWLEYNRCRCCGSDCDYTVGEGCGGKTVDGVLYCGAYDPKYDAQEKDTYRIETARRACDGDGKCVCRNDAASHQEWNRIKDDA